MELGGSIVWSVMVGMMGFSSNFFPRGLLSSLEQLNHWLFGQKNQGSAGVWWQGVDLGA
jgi:hypothetical protein